ncbi:carboxymuconolactone decarboxylase family protein [Streptomyces sp. HUAS MG47]|uniref:carboxymuconolactone decarboxylase family protein n=1 Tax=Streptomyces solicamelliae TaxID=3231716 RepID=UPI0038780A6E
MGTTVVLLPRAEARLDRPSRVGRGVRVTCRIRGGFNGSPREIEAVPWVYEGHGQLHDSAVESGALDVETEELVALTIAVSKEGDGCIAHHAQAAVRHGATEQEAAEAMGSPS